MSLSHGLWSEHKRTILQQVTHFNGFSFSTGGCGSLKQNASRFPPTSSPERCEGCVRLVLSDTNEHTQAGGPAADTVSPTKLQWWGHMAQYIYGQATHAHMCTHVMWIHGTVHLRGSWWREGVRGGGNCPLTLCVQLVCVYVTSALQHRSRI